jgi:hypothetical protein
MLLSANKEVNNKVQYKNYRIRVRVVVFNASFNNISVISNPETAYKQLVKPKIVTKLGTIISPIDKEETFKKENNKRRADIDFKTIPCFSYWCPNTLFKLLHI